MAHMAAAAASEEVKAKAGREQKGGVDHANVWTTANIIRGPLDRGC
jgi:hypothetical protein